MVRRVSDDFFGDMAVPGFAPVLSETASDIAWLGPPEIGSHNKEIYGGLLGLDDAELKRLKDAGII